MFSFRYTCRLAGALCAAIYGVRIYLQGFYRLGISIALANRSLDLSTQLIPLWRLEASAQLEMQSAIWRLLIATYKCSQVTHHMALLRSAEIWTYRILLTFRSSGSRKGTLTSKCCLLNELFRQIMGCSQVTLDIAQDLLSHSLFVRLILWSEK